MERRGRKLRNVLRISIVFIAILFGIFAEDSWAQMPIVISKTPNDGFINALINTSISIQFDMTMDTTSGHSFVDLEDDYGETVAGSIRWGTTILPNDTLIFVPQNPLKPATGYRYEGSAQSSTGTAWFNASFMTKFSTADVTPPTVQTTFPYSGMTGVSPPG